MRILARLRRRPAAFWRGWRDETTSSSGSTGGDPSNPGAGDSGGSSGGGDDSARDAVTSRQLTEHASQRVREVVGAALGAARKAGLEVPRGMTLQGFVEYAIGLHARSSELEADLADRGDAGDDPSPGTKDAEIKKLRAELRTAKEAVGAKDRIIEEKEAALASSRKRTDKLLTQREMRDGFKKAGLNDEAAMDWWFSEVREHPFRLAPPEGEGSTFVLVDKATDLPAINPKTGSPYAGLAEYLSEVKADPANSRLVAGKVAGSPGGGGARDTSDGKPDGSTSTGASATSKTTKPEEERSAMDWLEQGLKDGELTGAQGG